MAKTDRIYIRITPELKADLQQKADAECRTISNYLELLIKAALENNDASKQPKKTRR